MTPCVRESPVEPVIAGRIPNRYCRGEGQMSVGYSPERCSLFWGGVPESGQGLHPEEGGKLDSLKGNHPELLHGARVSSLGGPLPGVFHFGAAAPQTQMAPSEAKMGFTTADKIVASKRQGCR